MRDADKDNLELLTTEKDLARLKDDASWRRLAERARALPVTMKISGNGRLRAPRARRDQADLNRSGCSRCSTASGVE